MRPAADPGSWLVRTHPNPGAPFRLFCLPYAGGGGNVFRDWPTALPADIEVCALQLPGRERRILEPPYTELPPLVTAILAAMRSCMDRPFAIFGHSMGAILAFELARQLRREGGPEPAHLCVSGRQAPQLPDPEPPIHHLPEPEFIEGVRRFNGMPDQVLDSPDLMELVMPSLRADFRLCETYRYASEPPLDCDLTACGGLEDPIITRALLEPWQEQTSGAFTLRMFPGDHFYIDTARKQLLGILSQDLGALAAASTRS